MSVFEKITYFINKIPKTWRNFEKIPKIFKEDPGSFEKIFEIISGEF